MKIIVALVVLLAALSAVSAIPQKREKRPSNAMMVALASLMRGEVPTFSEEYTSSLILEDIKGAFKDGVVSTSFGLTIADRINRHVRGTVILTYKTDASQSSNSHMWEITYPEAPNVVVRTIVFSADGHWSAQ